jgi:hypothetical protein
VAAASPFHPGATADKPSRPDRCAGQETGRKTRTAAEEKTSGPLFVSFLDHQSGDGFSQPDHAWPRDLRFVSENQTVKGFYGRQLGQASVGNLGVCQHEHLKIAECR